MKSKLYSKFGTLNYAVNELDQNQLSFLKLHNAIFNRQLGAYQSRGGSYSWAVTGDIWGIGGHATKTTNPKDPANVVILRHRRDGSTSYIEKLDWSALTWSAITQGAVITGDLGIANTTSFAQIFEMTAVFGGMPGRINDIAAGNLNRLGCPTPTAPSAAASVGAGALTGNYRWVITYYDSATGYESSPSTQTGQLTLSAKNGELTSIPSTAAREGITHVRVYRTQRTGEEPFYYSGEVALGTTTYTDSVADASLGAEAPLDGDNDPPPNPSYLGVAHDNRLWVASESSLYYSKPYDGSYAPLEQFSEDRVEEFPFRITGLASAGAGRLLVFLPPGFGIYEITGRSETTFRKDLTYPAEGTQFKESVAAKGDMVSFYARDRFKVWTPGGLREPARQTQRELLREIVSREYSAGMYAWAAWHPVEDMLICGVSGVDATSAPLVDAITGSPVQVINASTGSVIPVVLA